MIVNGLGKLVLTIVKPALRWLEVNTQRWQNHDKNSTGDKKILTAVLHNSGATLTGNTQSSDLEWLAERLFGNSRLGAGDVKTVDWLLSRDQWADLGLQPENYFSDEARFWAALTADQQDAWRKLARIVMYTMPFFAERVGHRFLEQAKAIRKVWEEKR